MGKKKASNESRGFEDPERIMEALLPPGPAPSPEDPAAALLTIGEWNDTWISIIETQDTKRIAFSKELSEFIEDTKYLARWCESVGLDSSPLLEYANAAQDTYFGFQPTLPHRPDTLWVLLDRLEFRLQPFQPRPIAKQTAATDEKHRQRRSPIEAELAVKKFLKKNPAATIREVAKGVGIAVGSVSGMNVWQAEQARRKARKTPAPKREQRLTKQMLKTVGQKNDPAQRILAEEAAWQKIIATAKPRKVAELLAMTPEKRADLIQVFLEQYKDILEESDDDCS